MSVLDHEDPVCGMEVQPGRAAGKSDYNGTTYYFCSEQCKERFDRAPDQYLGRKTGSCCS